MSWTYSGQSVDALPSGCTLRSSQQYNQTGVPTVMIGKTQNDKASENCNSFYPTVTLAEVHLGDVSSKQQCDVRNDFGSIKQTIQVLNLKVDNMLIDLNAKIKHLVDMVDQCLKVENEAECSLTDEKSQLDCKPMPYYAAVTKCLTDAMSTNFFCHC